MTDQHRSSGFTLVETLIAVAMVVVLAASVAQLTTLSARALARSRLQTTAAHLASTRLEQLRALAWSYGSVYQPVPARDASTNVSAAEPADGGRGLDSSPADALDADRSGYVDYLDEAGRWLANTPPGPDAARFVRRWHVVSVAGYPDLLLVRVRVIDRRLEIQSFDLATLRMRTAG